MRAQTGNPLRLSILTAANVIGRSVRKASAFREDGGVGDAISGRSYLLYPPVASRVYRLQQCPGRQYSRRICRGENIPVGKAATKLMRPDFSFLSIFLGRSVRFPGRDFIVLRTPTIILQDFVALTVYIYSGCDRGLNVVSSGSGRPYLDSGSTPDQPEAGLTRCFLSDNPAIHHPANRSPGSDRFVGRQGRDRGDCAAASEPAPRDACYRGACLTVHATDE